MAFPKLPGYNVEVKRFLFLLSVFLFIGFVVFSYLVQQGHFVSTDFNLTVKFQDHISRKFDLPFSILTLFGSLEVTGIVWLVLLIYMLIKRYWWTAFFMLSFMLSQLAELYGKLFVFHPAPQFMFYRGALGFNFPSSYVQTGYSYPSGHATRTTFLVAFLIIYMALRFRGVHKHLFQIVLIIFLTTMYISRIYLGEHWTSDVIGGALLGGSLGVLSALTIPKKSVA